MYTNIHTRIQKDKQADKLKGRQPNKQTDISALSDGQIHIRQTMKLSNYQTDYQTDSLSDRHTSPSSDRQTI